jgi:hypothetical protein
VHEIYFFIFALAHQHVNICFALVFNVILENIDVIQNQSIASWRMEIVTLKANKSRVEINLES